MTPKTHAQAKWDITPFLLHNILQMEVMDSNEEEDMTKHKMLKKCLQDVIDHDDKEAAMKMLAKHHLEGEKPTKFFCSMMQP